MSATIKSAIDEVLEVWNHNVKANEVFIEYCLEIKIRKKNYYTSKTKFYTLPIAEILFISKGDENLLLWRKELQIPDKVKGVPKHQIHNNYIDQLYKYFLHECIGTFGVICSQSIKNQDYAEYDIEKDRLKPHPSFKDTVIECTENGKFYELGDTFDVFNKLENGYAVYTEHDVAKKTNGLAKIDFNHCKEIITTAQKIDLIVPKIPKIITL